VHVAILLVLLGLADDHFGLGIRSGLLGHVLCVQRSQVSVCALDTLPCRGMSSCSGSRGGPSSRPALIRFHPTPRMPAARWRALGGAQLSKGREGSIAPGARAVRARTSLCASWLGGGDHLSRGALFCPPKSPSRSPGKKRGTFVGFSCHELEDLAAAKRE
jgi:hypothetical protein